MADSQRRFFISATLPAIDGMHADRIIQYVRYPILQGELKYERREILHFSRSMLPWAKKENKKLCLEGRMEPVDHIVALYPQIHI